MRLTHNVFLEQQQKLLMTPKLQQAIAILQMSALELNNHIQEELEENPFLEEKDMEETGEYEKENADKDKSSIEDWLEYYNDRDTGYVQNNENQKSFDNFLTRRPSLYEHLEFQLHLEIKNQDDIEIGNYLIGSIDQNGYLCTDLNEVADKLNVNLQQVEKVLDIIHSFHPHGVGARDLAECLLLQLKHYGKESFLARRIIEDHLSDLAKGRLVRIAQALSTSVHKVQDICDLIRTLDPKPGLQYSNSNEIKYIVPDIFVEKVDGKYMVIVNDYNFPRLMINQVYETIMRQPNLFAQDVRKYLEDKMGSAVWLIRSIEQRRMTLYKVARTIINIQSDFLERGIKYLRPLKLSQVAELVEVHESTVSRATTNKYIQTPQGLFELKFFFSTGMESSGGSQKISSKSIKYMVEEIINNENPVEPLSDQAIAQILKEKGISISRRTVAKYRQGMGIPSTMTRKRYQS